MSNRKFKRVAIPPCPWHTQDKLSYLRASEDADNRMANGERQSQCHVCGYWFWPHEFGVDPFSKTMANRMSKLKED